MDTPAANNVLRDIASPQSPQPDKPTLQLKLRLDAPEITDVKIGEFLTETLPSLRLDFTKVGASYNFRLDLAAALRQKAGEQAEFEFQLLEVDAEFERLGLRCALEQNVLAASQRGRSHEHDGKFRDDSFAVALDAIDGWNFFAVGDGAGSAKFSRRGSQVACETVVARLAAHFQADAEKLQPAIQRLQKVARKTPGAAPLDGNAAAPVVSNIFHKALYETYVALCNEVKERNQNLAATDAPAQLRDYHTTLLCCALKKFAKGWALLSYWIGDGAFVVYRPNGEACAFPLGSPDGGEFAGQTRFFTTKEEIDAGPIQNRVRAAFFSDFDALLLATDGVSDPYFEVESDLLKFKRWQEFWQARSQGELFDGVFDPDLAPTERAERLKEGLRFKVVGHHDDRTLLLVANPNAFAPPPPRFSLLSAVWNKAKALPPTKRSRQSRQGDR